MPSQVLFISYSHEDQASVVYIRKELLNVGVTMWLDHDSLTPGTIDWGEAIETDIKASDAILFIVSPDSKKSRFVVHEIDLAVHHHKPIIPFWVKGNDWIDVAPFGMARTQYIDARSDILSSLKDLLHYLAHNLRFILTPLPPPPTSTLVSKPSTLQNVADPTSLLTLMNISGPWSAKRWLSSWSMHIEESNGELLGRGVQITVLGDMMEYDVSGQMRGNIAHLELAYNRNPVIKARLTLQLRMNVLAGTITENDGLAHAVEFNRLIVEQK